MASNDGLFFLPVDVFFPQFEESCRMSVDGGLGGGGEE